jgi:hypothetical protein
MELPTSTFTPRLSTSAPQLIDRPFDHRSIGKQRFDQSLDLAGQLKQSLPKSAKLLSVRFILYAHILIAYRFKNKSQEKKEGTLKFPLEGLPENLVVVPITVYSGLTTGRLIPPPMDSLLSESQFKNLQFRHYKGIGRAKDRRRLPIHADWVESGLGSEKAGNKSSVRRMGVS